MSDNKTDGRLHYRGSSASSPCIVETVQHMSGHHQVTTSNSSSDIGLTTFVKKRCATMLPTAGFFSKSTAVTRWFIHARAPSSNSHALPPRPTRFKCRDCRTHFKTQIDPLLSLFLGPTSKYCYLNLVGTLCKLLGLHCHRGDVAHLHQKRAQKKKKEGSKQTPSRYHRVLSPDVINMMIPFFTRDG